MYDLWGLDHNPGKAPEDLGILRAVLWRFLALGYSYEDFVWYHRNFNHEDANTKCSCGTDKTRKHIVHCHKTIRLFMHRPKLPFQPQTYRKEGLKYISSLLQLNPPNPKQDFEVYMHLTEY